MTNHMEMTTTHNPEQQKTVKNTCNKEKTAVENQLLTASYRFPKTYVTATVFLPFGLSLHSNIIAYCISHCYY